jgi:lipopolysaccharide transport system permease protein
LFPLQPPAIKIFLTWSLLESSASPVFFPLSGMAESSYKKFILANPMSGIIEAFRYGFTGKGYFNWALLSYDAGFILLLLAAGIVIFNITEKSFVDII